MRIDHCRAQGHPQAFNFRLFRSMPMSNFLEVAALTLGFAGGAVLSLDALFADRRVRHEMSKDATQKAVYRKTQTLQKIRRGECQPGDNCSVMTNFVGRNNPARQGLGGCLSACSWTFSLANPGHVFLKLIQVP
jgi:hypothetical protein